MPGLLWTRNNTVVSLGGGATVTPAGLVATGALGTPSVSGGSGAYAFPNQPTSGYTAWIDQTWALGVPKPWQQGGSADGWSVNNTGTAQDTNLAVLSGQGPPADPTNVLQITFPAGLTFGDAPCWVTSPASTLSAQSNGSALYLAQWYKSSSNFVTLNGLVKQWFTRTADYPNDNTNHFVGLAAGDFDNTGFFAMAGLQGSPLTTSLYAPNTATLNRNRSADQAATMMARGAWHTVEWLIEPATTAGGTDGRIRMYHDGTLVLDNKNYGSAGATQPWGEFPAGATQKWGYLDYLPTYGGSPNSVPETMTIQLGRVRAMYT